MKKKFKFICPCEDREITITWQAQDIDEIVEFCPFCSASIMDEDIPGEEDEDVSIYD